MDRDRYPCLWLTGATVTTNGVITSAPSAIFTYGAVHVETLSGLATVNMNGGSIGGGALRGITAFTDTGNIQINANSGTITARHGIYVSSNSGDVTINGNGAVINGGTTSSGGGIAASSDSGQVAVNMLAGTVSGGTGIRVFGASPTASVFIAAGATVTGNSIGLSVEGNNSSTTTVLGTVTGSLFAASYRGTLNIGNGAAAGTLNGNVWMLSSASVLNFNHANAATWPASFPVMAPSDRSAPAPRS